MQDPDKIRTYSGRWIYVIAILWVMYLILDTRNFVASFFPEKHLGFLFLGFIYLILSYSVTIYPNKIGNFLARLDYRLGMMSQKYVSVKPLCWLVGVVAIVIAVTTISCLILWKYIESVPISPQFADMLPLIRDACDVFLSGTNPYIKQYLMPWVLPLTFWPGMWMPYLPIRWSGWDLRWLHIATVCFMGLLFIWQLLLLYKRRDLGVRSIPVLSATLVALCFFLFSNASIAFAPWGHTAPQWAWIVVFSISILWRKQLATAVGLALLLATRQTSVIFLPLVWVYWLRTIGSMQASIRLVGVTGVLYFLLCGPFLLDAPCNFLVSPISHYSALGELDFTRGVESYSANSIGLSFTIRSFGGAWLLSISILIALIAPLLSAWWRIKNEEDLLLHMAFASIVVVLVAPIPWYYEYFTGLLLISFGAIAVAAGGCFPQISGRSRYAVSTLPNSTTTG